MKTVTRTLLFATLSLSILGTAAFAEPQTELAKILDMFAVREADVYTVHIIADGDISEFSSALEQRESFYKLTLDVPALPPLDTEYEVETPFSRRFQVWPMQLEKKLLFPCRDRAGHGRERGRGRAKRVASVRSHPNAKAPSSLLRRKRTP